jgi:protein-disulfide isomerase
MQKHASWIVALVVGIAIGAVGDHMIAGRGGGSSSTATAPPTGKPGDLPGNYYKESDLPAGTLAGLNDSQKYAVLKVINEKHCNCGCPNDTIAHCRKTDPACKTAPELITQAINLAKQGKGAEQIRKEMDGGAAAAAKPTRPSRPQEDPKAVYKIPVDDSPIKGRNDALITIVESSDFECPFCKRVGPIMKQITEAYGDKVRFAFKHNPLSFHPKAMPAAIVAEEAMRQGGATKFWDMHDKLFELAPALDRPNLEKAAAELKLDVEQVKKALDTNRHEAKIKKDQAQVVGLGASGTPAFFVNGRKLSGAQPFDRFKALIDEELAKAEEMIKAGTPKKELYAKIIEKGSTTPVMLPGGDAGKPGTPPPSPVRKVEFRPDDPAKGPKNAKVTIVEFSEFQCPFCSRVAPTLKQITDTYKNDVKLVFKHQPLGFHAQAMPAAEVSEAAREQGKFWEMHDLMFAGQKELGPAKYEEWAKKVGLNMGRFKQAVDSHKFKARIEEDQKVGNSVGATGTPTFFVNCRQIVGAQPFERFKEMIDEEIKKADEMVKKGTRLDSAFYGKICDENVKGAPSAPVAQAAEPTGPVKVDIRPDDPVKGNPKAPITIVEFSEFQCPFCSRVMPTLKQITDTYKNQVKVVFKHQPLPFHNNAMSAAEASEAAREQGKFWEMHDKLFAGQRELSPANYEKWAQEIGLDMGQFKQAMESRKHKGRVEADSQQGMKIGATGTPTFFVNGHKLEGAQPFERFKEVIDRELQKAQPVQAKN